MPHLLGPTTRINPLTNEVAARNLRIWAALMVVGGVIWIASAILR